MHMDSILIIEDNQDICQMLAEFLGTAGYAVSIARTGTSGREELATKKYDLLLLDLMLPYKSGDEILRELRVFSDIPVIVISAKDLVGTKVDLLKLGADDYITKPFDLQEVAARVESHLRRSRKAVSAAKILSYKDLRLNREAKQIIVNGKELSLTATEYLILELLCQNRDKVFTKANVYQSIWGCAYLGDENAVKTHISNVRTKLKAANPDKEYIETVWGLGYRLYRE